MESHFAQCGDLTRIVNQNRSPALYGKSEAGRAHPMEYADLSNTIIGCAMRVHSALGPGFLEAVYQNALAHELRKTGLEIENGRCLQVIYDGVVVGDFSADMVIEGVILVENKAVQKLIPSHEIQLVNYLTATGIDIGLLLNFGARRLEYKRKTRVFPVTRAR